MNKAREMGLFSSPLPLQHSSDFPVIQYVDDTLLIMEASARQLVTLKSLLFSFSNSTRLRVNYSMYPINITDQKLDHLAQTFDCVKGSLPFTYLGLPLSLRKPKVIDFSPLVTKCERRLVATSSFLNQAGRLQIANSVITALPTFALSTFQMHKTVLDQIDKYRRHCIWRGSDMQSKKPSKVDWEKVRKPKKDGGLGVLNVQTHNEAMLLKFLDKFITKRICHGLV
jgi:hypothetical protein